MVLCAPMHSTNSQSEPPKSRMTTLPTFCFVVPCFNEQGNVEPTVGSIRAAMGGRSDYEIILVNDASTDRTLEEMRALAAEDPRIRVLDSPTNLGFGGSSRRGPPPAAPDPRLL